MHASSTTLLPAPNTADTADRIVEVAIDAFARHGFAAVSTRALAAAAGVNIATLSYHFGSKLGVYEAAVARVYARLQASADTLLPTVAAAPLAGQVRAAVALSRQHQPAVRLLVREVLDNDGMTEATARAHFLPAVERYTSLAASMLGVRPERARQAIVAAGYLLSRFAMQDDDALRAALAIPADDAVEDHLTAIVLRCFHALVDNDAAPAD